MRQNDRGAAMLAGTGRGPLEQAAVNLSEALRVLNMLPVGDSELVPHPLIVLRAEIENARRYMSLAISTAA